MRRAAAWQTVAAIGLTVLGIAGASAIDWHEQGKAAYARGDYAAAEAMFARGLRVAPQDGLLQYHRGVALLRLGRWQDARVALESALRLGLDPSVARGAREGLLALGPAVRAPARSPRNDVDVVLEPHMGVWIVEALLNDHVRARLIVDTGASLCVVSGPLAERLGLQPGRTLVPLQTANGAVNAPLVRIPSVRVGEAEVDDFVAAVTSIGPIDGLLGNSFLGRFDVSVDVGRRMLTLRPRR